VIGLRNFTFYATIPVNLLLILWVWMGRALFGAGGWWFLIFMVSVVPVLLLALTATSVLAMVQRRPRETGRLTSAQFWTLSTVWASMLGFGFFIVDFGDSPDSAASAFTQLVGTGSLATSNSLSGIFFVLAIVSYIALLVLLIIGVSGRAERRSREAQANLGVIDVPWPHTPPPNTMPWPHTPPPNTMQSPTSPRPNNTPPPNNVPWANTPPPRTLP
jgi:hypothetical protein